MKKIWCLSFACLIVAVSLASAEVADPLAKIPTASPDLYHPERITKMPVAPDEKPFAEHFIVLHISSGDEVAQKLLLNNAQNLANFYGPDKVMIEVVAYGPGLRTLFKENQFSKRIQRLSYDSGITFTACANTMKAMGREHKALNKVAKVVPGGVVRLTELQEAGWTYIRP